MQVANKTPTELKPRLSNPRTHDAKQIAQIARSIEKFGFINPILIDRENSVIAGHGRLAAAKQLKMAEVPTLCVDHLTPAQIRAYVIADNRIAEKAGWDRELLAIELEELSIELDFEVEVTGFETAEIDLLLHELHDSNDPADEILPNIDRSKPSVTRAGDLWRLGNHLLYCGNALVAESYTRLLGEEKAQMVFTDPPYNVPIDGHVSGRGKIRHNEFGMASGEMSQAEFSEFLAATFQHLKNFSQDGSMHFVCMDWRHMREVMDAADGLYSELKNLCVWAKTNAGLGSLYRSQHELVFVYKNGTAAHINNVELGRFGRNRTNVWQYAGVNAFGKERDAELGMHPTVKPLHMVADAILDCSTRGGIILDPFAGSGTTLLAAENTGRLGRAIELDPYYADTIIRRFESALGIKAVRADSGEYFGVTQTGILGAINS